MSYRPKHTLIIVVNADGSGYAKQFSTITEAREAYKAIVTDGVAFLYPSARKSISSEPVGSLPPISSTGITEGGSKGMTFTTVQNIGFGPCPPLGTILQVGLNADFGIHINGVYYIVGNATYNIVADGDCGTTQPNTALTFVPSGELLGSQGNYNYYSDGEGGYYEDHVPEEGCDPSGTILEEANSSPIMVTISGQFHQIGTRTFNIIADGNCGTAEETTVTEYIPVDTFVTDDEMFNFYSDGIGYVYPVAKLIGTDTEDTMVSLGWTEVSAGTRGRDRFADGTFGEWSEWQYVASGTLYGDYENYNYYADGTGSYYTEEIPSCESSGNFAYSDDCNNYYHDGNCGYYSEGNGNCGGGCEPYGTYAYSDDCSNYYHDGNCDYYSEDNGNCGGGCESYGTYAYSDDCNNYYHDGNCDYYSEDNGNCGGGCEDSMLHDGESGWTYDGCYWSYSEPCPESGLPTGNSGFREMQIYISELGASYWHGDEEYVEYADGSCGVYDSVLNETYFESGRVIAMDEYYDDGTGTTIVTVYVADGNGGYYVENW
jgi:hypothetical protein